MKRHAGATWQLSFGIGLPVVGILIVLFAIATDAALLVCALAFLLTTAGLTLLSSWSRIRRQPMHGSATKSPNISEDTALRRYRPPAPAHISASVSNSAQQSANG